MRHKPDPRVLDLFQEAGRNVQQTAVLLRELMSDYPESNGVGAEIVACEHEGDRIAHDILHHVAQQAVRHAVPEPADVHALTVALDDIVDFAEEAADQLASALTGLHDGIDAGPHLVEIHRLENEADRIVREAVASLFVNGIDPMVVIRWKDIFESLEASVDACESVAHVLEGMALRRRG